MTCPPDRFLPGCDGFFRSIAYNFETKVGRIDMALGTHIGRVGVVDIFRAIDPEVRAIEVQYDGAQDVFHVRNKNSSWRTAKMSDIRAPQIDTT